MNIFLKGKNLLCLSGLTFSLFYKHRFLIAMFAKPTNIIDFLKLSLKFQNIEEFTIGTILWLILQKISPTTLIFHFQCKKMSDDEQKVLTLWCNVSYIFIVRTIRYIAVLCRTYTRILLCVMLCVYGGVALLWHNAKVLALLKVRCKIH